MDSAYCSTISPVPPPPPPPPPYFDIFLPRPPETAQWPAAVTLPPSFSFGSLCRTLLERVIFDDDGLADVFSTNALVLHETFVIRLFQRMCDAYRVSWNTILETTRPGLGGVLEPRLHVLLADIWETRVHRNVSLEDQNCYERVMGRDHVRFGDLVKLAPTLSRVAARQNKVWEFYAVDGYLGDDPKRYVDQFRYDARELCGKHVRAVRALYRYVDVDHPDMMKDTLEAIFKGSTTTTTPLAPEARDVYVRAVGGWEAAQRIGAWRSEQRDKKKRADETTTSPTTTTTANPASRKKKARDGEEGETTKRPKKEHVAADKTIPHHDDVGEEGPPPLFVPTTPPLFVPTTPPGSPPPRTPTSPPSPSPTTTALLPPPPREGHTTPPPPPTPRKQHPKLPKSGKHM